jgi:hypothetical protein
MCVSPPFYVHVSYCLQAYWEAEQDAAEKAREKRHERVIKRWTKLIQGLRIRHRIMEQYRSKEQHEPMDVHMEREKEVSLPALWYFA